MELVGQKGVQDKEQGVGEGGQVDLMAVKEQSGSANVIAGGDVSDQRNCEQEVLTGKVGMDVDGTTSTSVNEEVGQGLSLVGTVGKETPVELMVHSGDAKKKRTSTSTFKRRPRAPKNATRKLSSSPMSRKREAGGECGEGEVLKKVKF